MNAELFRAGAETRDLDLHWSSVGPGHDRASFCLIELAGYAARGRLDEHKPPYFAPPFGIYSMNGFRSEHTYATMAPAKRAVRKWALDWLESAPELISWIAEDTGFHFTARANGIQVANYYYCPEPVGNWHKGFRVWFGGTYYVTDFASPEEARSAAQETYTCWLRHARSSLLK